MYHLTKKNLCFQIASKGLHFQWPNCNFTKYLTVFLKIVFPNRKLKRTLRHSNITIEKRFDKYFGNPNLHLKLSTVATTTTVGTKWKYIYLDIMRNFMCLRNWCSLHFCNIEDLIWKIKKLKVQLLPKQVY